MALVNKNVLMVFASCRRVICLRCWGFSDIFYFCLGASSEVLIIFSSEHKERISRYNGNLSMIQVSHFTWYSSLSLHKTLSGRLAAWNDSILTLLPPVAYAALQSCQELK